jgi:MraW methylase family
MHGNTVLSRCMRQALLHTVPNHCCSRTAALGAAPAGHFSSLRSWARYETPQPWRTAVLSAARSPQRLQLAAGGRSLSTGAQAPPSTASAAADQAAPSADLGSAAPAQHTPVLLDEVLGFYADVRLRTFVDGTLGAGGHACAIAAAHQVWCLLHPGSLMPPRHAIYYGDTGLPEQWGIANQANPLCRCRRAVVSVIWPVRAAGPAHAGVHRPGPGGVRGSGAAAGGGAPRWPGRPAAPGELQVGSAEWRDAQRRLISYTVKGYTWQQISGPLLTPSALRGRCNAMGGCQAHAWARLNARAPATSDGAALGTCGRRCRQRLAAAAAPRTASYWTWACPPCRWALLH